RWGCWVSLGIPVAVFLAILFGIVNPPEDGASNIFSAHEDFIGVMALLGYFPALMAGLAGSIIGAYIGQQREGT
ncbi:MAG: hypothetical protein M3220_12050, partial [Chloroflexota bacterium]|nr:hypothetical protein [Chloroflexota bacterium]